jgi:MHS family shikimate/dehydroshikimate transporter-like MFS transporter
MRRKIKSLLQQRVQVGYGVGLLSTGLVSLISSLTTDEQFLSWGWRLPFLFSVVLVLMRCGSVTAWRNRRNLKRSRARTTAAGKAAAGRGSAASPSGSVLLIIALRLCELLTMYIVTAFALNYSTQNLGLPRELFLNIGLLVGGLSCLTIPCFAWLADRFGRRRIYITGALIGTLSGSRSLWRWRVSRFLDPVLRPDAGQYRP